MTGGQSPAEITAEGIAALTAWAAGVTEAEIPDAVYRQAAVVLCDDLAAMVSAREDPVLSKLCDDLLRHGGTPESTLFRGGRQRSDRYSAALANGAAGPWTELDEGSRRVSCHAGIYALPALLAEAEATELSVRETLRALILAYDIVTRLALTFPQPSLKLHPHASLSAVGAAAAIAAARRYDAATFLAALTTAATLVSPGPFDHAVLGSFVRNIWVAQGAWAGLRAADWALCGIAGLAAGPHAVFREIFGCDCAPDQLTFDLGEDWQINHNFQKIYPCCQYAHSAVEAIEDLAAGLPEGVDLRDSAAIEVEIHESGLRLNETHPATILGARFSIPHITAVAVLRGRVDTETLSPASLDDAEIADLRPRVSLRPFEPSLPPPNDRPARVRIRLSDGREYQAECLCARGSPSRPFELETIRRKIDGLCGAVYPRMPDIVDRLVDLEAGVLDGSWADLVTDLTGDD